MAGPDRRGGEGYRAVLAGLDGLLRRVELVCAVFAGAAALLTMALVSVDAVMRHFFAAPLTFQRVLTEDYLLVALLLLAMPWGYRTGGFIRIDMLMNNLPAALRSLLLRAGLLASGLYIGRLAWLAFDHFHAAWLRDDVVMGVIDWPVWLSWIWLPLGLGLLAVRLLLDAASPLRGAPAPASAPLENGAR